MNKVISSMNIAMALLGELLISTAAQASDNPLLADQWQYRPLVVMAASDSDPQLLKLRQQLQTPAMRTAWQQRDLVLYTLINGQASRNEVRLSAPASQALAASLPAQASRPPHLVLIGKDGEPKLVTEQLDSLDSIFNVIDSMPMRRQEMQKR